MAPDREGDSVTSDGGDFEWGITPHLGAVLGLFGETMFTVGLIVFGFGLVLAAPVTVSFVFNYSSTPVLALYAIIPAPLGLLLAGVSIIFIRLATEKFEYSQQH